MSGQTNVARARRTPHLQVLLHDPCPYCGDDVAAIDHITATANGGSDDWPNLSGICRSCNSAKGTKSMLAFMAWRLWVGERIAAATRFGAAWNSVGRPA